MSYTIESKKSGKKIVMVNPTDRDWTRQRFVFAIGIYSPVYLVTWANGLCYALDGAIDWIADNAPGMLCDNEINDEYFRALAQGFGEEEAREMAEEDTTCGGNYGNYLRSDEWRIVAENPTRHQMLALIEAL